MGVLIQKLNRQHPEYALYSAAWNDFDLLNCGGARLKLNAGQFLVKRPKELFDVFSERLRRVTYQNILGTALGWYVSALFKRNPQIEIKPTDAWYTEDFLLNADRAGTTFIDMFRQVFKCLFLYRTAYILSDRPHAEFEPQTRAEEQAMGLDEPYNVVYEPSQVINWANDDRGSLNWCVIRVQSDAGDFLGDYDLRTRWYYFDRTKFQVYEDKQLREPAGQGTLVLFDGGGNQIAHDSREATLIAEGDHGLASLNKVPVTRVQVPDEMWMANRVYLQTLDHFNQDNSYAWALFNSNLAMPIVYSDKKLESLTMSEVAFLQLGEKDKFEWTEPAGNSFQWSDKRLAGLREECFRTLYLQAQGRSSAATPAAQSGYSKELDMVPANDVLNAFGDKLRASMQETGQNISVLRGKAQVKWDVTGFRFETKPVSQSVGVAQEMSDVGIFGSSPTLEREAFKSVANDFLEDRNDAIKKTVADEIDASPTTAERADAAEQAQQKAFTTSFQKATSKTAVSDELGAAAA